MFSWRLTVKVQVWKIFIKLEYHCFFISNQTCLNIYFKGIKILWVLNFTIGKKLHFAGIFAIWWVQNISRVFNFAISVKIRNDCLIVNQCNQICCRNSNFLTICRAMRNISIIIIIWWNIRKKESQTRQVFDFAIRWLWDFLRVQNFAKIVKNRNNLEI